MKLLTIDFETYYSKELGFAKQTTEEYVRDPLFHVIGVAVKVDGAAPAWASGSRDELKIWLSQFPWEESMALAHNAMFDGAILNWLFDIRPKVWVDTLCMGRALHGVDVGGSLAKLAERYEVGVKGEEVKNFLGYRRQDFKPEELSAYGDYCINDTELTYKIFSLMVRSGFPKAELKLIDLTIRMFTEPVLGLDLLGLEQHLIEVRDRKADLLEKCGLVTNELLMSNPKFAEVLQGLGVVPPRKISATTHKVAWAFAKSDEEFKALLEHPDERVQSLVAARIGTKSTLEETRTERMIGIAKRGTMPVPLKYYAAHTGRWGGSDSLNLQNLPSRTKDGNRLKKSITAPPNHMIIDCDSSQIEARVLAWLAGQDDAVETFAKREDVYKRMASKIYDVPEEEVTPAQRFVGKTTVLGAGYGMGAPKFMDALRGSGVEVTLDESRRIIRAYREANYAIVGLWKQGQSALTALCQGATTKLGKEGVLTLVPDEMGIRLPNGLLMRYSGLNAEQGMNGLQYTYKTRRGLIKIYGGKVIENVVQALARIVVGEQMILIAKKYRPVLTVHDAIACVVPQEEALSAQVYIEECMRIAPSWASGLPVNCESGIGQSYGEC